MTARDATVVAVVDTFASGGDGLPPASQGTVHVRLLAEVEALARPAFGRHGPRAPNGDRHGRPPAVVTRRPARAGA